MKKKICALSIFKEKEKKKRPETSPRKDGQAREAQRNREEMRLTKANLEKGKE